ncbi:MAG: 2Fe-2S iron-sulfur cluster binding domain-containing protein [Rhodospirillum sp.]|nr:2Fe-2S iron-sulfur cluster binding domain-containing protein [Rhodospirillum sp.]MCF8488745.1 2Fe-2S iron-sulfur cluster binding domain-containing protein [Rhodospirillum sp.]MCF8501865.1 2Fe-2S iron-sulfur cluster binding domain-containing protein [Rhodospirillum sp.]
MDGSNQTHPSAPISLLAAIRQGAGPRHRVRVLGGGDVLCGEGERLLIAIERTGGGGVLVGCRRGGCGVCRIQVLEGTYETDPMSVQHVPEEERAEGYALACCVRPTSDLVVVPAFKKPPRRARWENTGEISPQTNEVKAEVKQ